MMNFIHRFLQDQNGATAIEYAAIAGFLSIVIVTVVVSIGLDVKTMLSAVVPAFD